MEHLEPIAHLVPEIKELLAQKSFNVLKDLLNDIRAEDISESWYRFSNEDKVGLFKLLSAEAALVLFECLEVQEQRFLLETLEANTVAPVLEGISPSDVAGIFQTLPRKFVKRMISLVRKADAVKHIKQLMTYEPDTAGSLLHPEFIKLNPNMTSRAALSLIHSVARIKHRRHLWSLYVTSPKDELLGSLTLESLIAAAPDSTLNEIMSSVAHSKLSPDTDQEQVAQNFAKYGLLSAPVVDENNRLLGVVLVDDIVDVIKQEATEDIAKIAGTSAEEFQEESLWRIAWYRAPWLLATLVGQFMVFFVIRHFEFALSEVVALAFFLPLIPAMGGNVGAQSAMIFVRNVAIGQLKGTAKYRQVVKELGIGLILGLFYGSVTGIAAFLIGAGSFGIPLCVLVALSVWIAMAVAAAAGAIGPLVLEKIGIDPATAVGPMVTTTADLLSVTIYFVLAVTLLLGGG
jgi:magnesium transporter